MGKSQRSTPAMNVDTQTSTWNDMCPPFSPSFLGARHDSVHLQYQKPLIGSPPPRGGTFSSLRLEVPIFNPHDGDQENNNYTGDGFLIATKNVPNVGTVDGLKMDSQHDFDKEVDDATKLTKRVLELKLQHQPIIVYDNIEDDNEENSAISMEDDDVLTLTVPAIDVSDEKKRPPLSGFTSH